MKCISLHLEEFTSSIRLHLVESVLYFFHIKKVRLQAISQMSASKLYAAHIPLTPISRVLLGIGSAAAAITDPKRGDMVAAMGETTAIGPVLENIRERMESDVVGRKLLKEKPRISNETVDRKWLAGLPAGTLGKLYSE